MTTVNFLCFALGKTGTFLLLHQHKQHAHQIIDTDLFFPCKGLLFARYLVQIIKKKRLDETYSNLEISVHFLLCTRVKDALDWLI